MKKDLRASRFRHVATVSVAVLTAILAACSDAAAPSSPTAADRTVDPVVEQALAKASALSATIPESKLAQGLLREKPLANAVTVTKVIKSDGGKIEIPAADFELDIPKGAFVGDTMTFSVTALPGSAVAYNFEPHGTTFPVPLQFVQKVGHTNLKGVKVPPGFVAEIGGAYFTDPSLIDPTTGIAVVAETMTADPTAVFSKDQITFSIWHFSGYMASTGRR